MGDEWKVYPLRRLVIVHREQVNPLDYPQQDFLHFSIPAYDDGQRPVTHKGYEIKSSKFLVPPDSVLLSRINPRFPRVWLPNIDASIPAVASTEFLVCTPKDGIDRRFLFYACLSPQFYKDLRGRVTGTSSSHQRVRPEDALSIPVPVPPLPEQRTIAHILGTLDDKIELNRRMNETLEAMARALFKSWFVDFDPVVVNAIKAGNPIPEKFAKRAAHYRQNPDALRLPEHILRLFPDRFVDSELGSIPEGWEVARLGDMVVTVKGRSYKSSELMPSERALVTLKSFKRGGGYQPDGLKPYIGTFKPEQEVTPGEVVIACTDVTQDAEVIGRPALVRPSPHFQTLIASLDTMIVRPRTEELTQVFLYFLLSARAFIGHAYAHTTGTTVLHLSKNAVPSFVFAYPGVELVAVFNSLAESILEQLEASEQETHTLIGIRNTLLPKLVSGELRVPATALEELSAQTGAPYVERHLEESGT